MIKIMNSYFHYFFILVMTFSEHKLISSERTLTEEQWHHLRFGSDANQWALNNPTDGQTDPENGQTISGANDGSIENNVRTVDVGKDKLVLVNDEGTIKMLRASQFPIAPKSNGDTNMMTTPPSMVQMPFNSYFEAKGTNTNPSTNPIEYITQKFGAGHKGAGIPVTFASGSKTDRPNVMYQNFEENPCRVSATSQPIYIPSQQLNLPNASSRSAKMVRIIIEMPESMTRNVDEASRYAASQVKKLKLPISSDMNQEISIDTLKRKSQKPTKVKNVQEIIRKVIHLEEDEGEGSDAYGNGSSDSDHEEVPAQQTNGNNYVMFNNKDSNSGDSSKKILLVRNGNRFMRRNRDFGNLRQLNKYKKVIKIYGE